jgi:hypothetical protein
MMCGDVHKWFLYQVRGSLFLLLVIFLGPPEFVKG